MLKDIFKPPWELTDDINNVEQIIFSQRVVVQHCFREGNETVDALAKYGAKLSFHAFRIKQVRKNSNV